MTTDVAATRRRRVNVSGWLVVGVVIGGWELAIRAAWITFRFVPPPSRIAVALWDLAAAGELGRDVGHTVWVTLIASAYDMAPNALWFPPLIETLGGKHYYLVGNGAMIEEMSEALSDLGEGLVPTGWSDDGLVEAVEHRSGSVSGDDALQLEQARQGLTPPRVVRSCRRDRWRSRRDPSARPLVSLPPMCGRPRARRRGRRGRR